MEEERVRELHEQKKGKKRKRGPYRKSWIGATRNA